MIRIVIILFTTKDVVAGFVVKIRKDMALSLFSDYGFHLVC